MQRVILWEEVLQADRCPLQTSARLCCHGVPTGLPVAYKGDVCLSVLAAHLLANLQNITGMLGGDKLGHVARET